MKDTNALIYVVEDDEGIGEVYEGAFEDEYLVKIFSSGKEFFEVFEFFYYAGEENFLKKAFLPPNP